jgi:H+/Cl- antiporter ClcA
MSEERAAHSSVSDGLTIAPALDLVAEAAQVPPVHSTISWRTIQICGLAMLLGAVAGLVAPVLVGLIAFVTNLAFYGRFSLDASASPAAAVPQMGAWVIVIPVIGSLIVGYMARYGSKAIRGHGIPEAMEQVLTNESRIPARITFLKPVSSAIAIGTGGPFGAEGPIIATGGAMGSVLGQLLRTTATERKTLLAAGAAAGMSATFCAPVSAVLLAVELLLFEFRPRSLVPVALASCIAAGVRIAIEGHEAAFAMPDVPDPSVPALVVYIMLGAVMGLVAIGVSKAIFFIEDGFEKLPIHWMWWPAIGGLVVGIVGYFVPDTLGVGYYNIGNILSDKLAVPALLLLCGAKFVSWSISLGSGTSGGTLAPLFTIGGGVGGVLGIAIATLAPALAVDPRIAALVGMAAIFAGASRAMLASAVFAFETTQQTAGILPLLGGCAAASLICGWLSRNSIMTEKIARRGIRTPAEYEADLLHQVSVRDVASEEVVTITASATVATVREWLLSGVPGTTHQGFPVVDEKQHLRGVITRKEVLDPSKPAATKVGDLLRRLPVYVYDDCSVREAADHLVNHNVGRLPVVSREQPTKLAGIITRSDILSVFRRRVQEAERQEPNLRWPLFSRNAS